MYQFGGWPQRELFGIISKHCHWAVYPQRVSPKARASNPLFLTLLDRYSKTALVQGATNQTGMKVAEWELGLQVLGREHIRPGHGTAWQLTLPTRASHYYKRAQERGNGCRFASAARPQEQKPGLSQEQWTRLRTRRAVVSKYHFPPRDNRDFCRNK